MLLENYTRIQLLGLIVLLMHQFFKKYHDARKATVYQRERVIQIYAVFFTRKMISSPSIMDHKVCIVSSWLR